MLKNIKINCLQLVIIYSYSLQFTLEHIIQFSNY